MTMVSNPELDSVTSKFMFKSYISAPLHGFAFWFETEFSQMESELSSLYLEHAVESVSSPILSTAPDAPATHWKQVLIDCDDVIELEKGQTIEGSVTITQNDMKQRFLVILLQYASGGKSYEKVVSFL